MDGCICVCAPCNATEGVANVYIKQSIHFCLRLLFSGLAASTNVADKYVHIQNIKLRIILLVCVDMSEQRLEVFSFIISDLSSHYLHN